MNRRTAFFFLRRAGASAAILAPVILLTATVGFVVMVQQGSTTNAALRFIGLVLVWSFLVAWCVVTIASLLALHRRLKSAGISLEQFARLPREERDRLRKRGGS